MYIYTGATPTTHAPRSRPPRLLQDGERLSPARCLLASGGSVRVRGSVLCVCVLCACAVRVGVCGERVFRSFKKRKKKKK